MKQGPFCVIFYQCPYFMEFIDKRAIWDKFESFLFLIYETMISYVHTSLFDPLLQPPQIWPLGVSTFECTK